MYVGYFRGMYVRKFLSVEVGGSFGKHMTYCSMVLTRDCRLLYT